jgi:hypothetical protein
VDDPMADDAHDELRDEYRFDYRKARRNRFAADLPAGGRIVYLDPTVAAVFTDSESVNRVLRAVLDSMPGQPPHTAEPG